MIWILTKMGFILLDRRLSALIICFQKVLFGGVVSVSEQTLVWLVNSVHLTLLIIICTGINALVWQV